MFWSSFSDGPNKWDEATIFYENQVRWTFVASLLNTVWNITSSWRKNYIILLIFQILNKCVQMFCFLNSSNSSQCGVLRWLLRSPDIVNPLVNFYGILWRRRRSLFLGLHAMYFYNYLKYNSSIIVYLDRRTFYADVIYFYIYIYFYLKLTYE